MYGVNTGCGSRKNEVMNADELIDYQARYIPAHSCGIGDALDGEIVRGAMLIRLNSFMRGTSGVSPELCLLLKGCLNRGFTPIVPRYGSLGASGDLVPLAHTCAALIGLPQAEAMVDGTRMSAREGLSLCGLTPHVLGAKEALAFTNGANFIAAMGCLAVLDAEELNFTAHVALSLSLEAIRGETTAFDARLHEARPLPGQVRSAEMIRQVISGSRRMTAEARQVSFSSEIVDVDRSGEKVPRVQDAYSFRCAPQIYAGAFHALDHARELLAIEINSSTDNPLLCRREDGRFEALSGGNFHAQPLASMLEYLGLTLQPLAGASDRRMFALLSPRWSYGLPGDLAGPAHGNTGLMIAQYSGASLVNKATHLAHPCSIHNIPSSANQEDWVSMGMTSALNLREMIPIIRAVLAIELVGATQGLLLTEEALPTPLRALGRGTQVAFDVITTTFDEPPDAQNGSDAWFRDRYLATQLEEVSALIERGELCARVRAALSVDD